MEPKKDIKRIAIFYPFSDFHNPTSGASVRVNNLVRLLSYGVNEIRIMQRWNKQELLNENIRLESVRLNEDTFGVRFFEKIFRLIFVKFIAKNQTFEPKFLLLFIEPFLYRKFKKSLFDLVKWADIVILEYPFWGYHVAKACKEKKIPFILTNHDFISEHITQNKVIYYLVRFLELTSLKKADHVIAVTQDNAKKFEKFGIKSDVIENRVDCLYWGQDFPGDPKDYLKSKGIDLPKGPLCFFIGGDHFPNIKAVEEIKKIGASMYGKYEVTFLLAGACAPKEDKKNIISLGKIDKSIILALYKIVEIVLIPLKSGSGSSIKTIEAMAAGCAILGTEVGFRGINTINYHHCVIENDLDKFPKIIMSLLNDSKKRYELGKNAKIWSHEKDYRKEFMKYFDLLNIKKEKIDLSLIEKNDLKIFNNYIKS